MEIGCQGVRKWKKVGNHSDRRRQSQHGQPTKTLLSKCRKTCKRNLHSAHKMESGGGGGGGCSLRLPSKSENGYQKCSDRFIYSLTNLCSTDFHKSPNYRTASNGYLLYEPKSPRKHGKYRYKLVNSPQ